MSGLCAFADASVTGYEIHMGVSAGPAFDVPAFLIEGRGEGARSQDEAILGSYLHGMFDMPDACAALLRGVPGQRCKRQYGAAARSEP